MIELIIYYIFTKLLQKLARYFNFCPEVWLLSQEIEPPHLYFFFFLQPPSSSSFFFFFFFFFFFCVGILVFRDVALDQGHHKVKQLQSPKFYLFIFFPGHSNGRLKCI